MAITNVPKWNLTADGSGDGYVFIGGFATVYVRGTFGGGTVEFQCSPTDEDADYLSMGTAVEFTDEGQSNFELGGPVYIRPDLSGSSSPDITIEIRYGKRHY